MKNIKGFWLPDGDTYFVDKPNYESRDTEAALRHVTNFRTAIDIGAHCGYWTQRLSKKFKTVVSLEPVDEHFQCLKQNTKNCRNVSCLNSAASQTSGTLHIEQFTENSGKSRVSESGIPIDAITIDSLNLDNVDFMKIDVEGHEKDVILGAVDTIKTYKPIIFMEINEKYDVMERLLTSMGYKNMQKLKFNYIWKAIR